MVIMTVLYFLHPTLTEKALALFRCRDIDGTSRMKYDFEVKCWETAHLVWTIGVGVPVMAFWVIGLPVFGIIFILKNRHNLEK